MSSPPANPSAASVRLEDVIALHREIAALVRAGIPLELGLRGFAGGLPSRLGRLADRISDRMNEGCSLADAFEAEGGKESAVYSAVIGAGLRSGRLAEALEALAASSEQIQETRRHLMLALIHPTIVALLAYVLFAVLGTAVIDRYLQAADDFNLSKGPVFVCLQWIHDNTTTLLWLIPLLIGVMLLAARYWIRAESGSFGFVGMYYLNRAQFTEILRLQIDHGLPLSESLVRAANSTTDIRLKAAAKNVAEELDRGVSLGEAISQARAIPPMMRWALASGGNRQDLVKSLKSMSDSYRDRALRNARLLKVWLPVLMTVVVSGTIAFVYGVVFFSVVRAFYEGLLRE